jgi:hypothetical protein
MHQQLDTAIDDHGWCLSRGERNRLDRFRAWLDRTDDTEPDRHVFIAYGAEIGSRGLLVDLEKAMSKLFSPRHEIRIELRAAVRDHIHRFDGERMLIDVLRAPYWRPFLPHRHLDHLNRHDVFRLDSWLAWLHQHQVQNPTVHHYLEYADEQGSSEYSLVCLRRVFAKIDTPKIYAIEIELPKAITRKRAQRCAKLRKPRVRKKIDRRSIMPDHVREALAQLEMGHSSTGKRCPAQDFLPTIERSLHSLVVFCKHQEFELDFSKGCLIPFARYLKKRGLRASTRDVTLSAIIRFRYHLQVEYEDQAEIRGLFRDIRNDKKSEVARLNGKLARVGTIHKTLTKAVELLHKSRKQRSLERRISYLCSAVALALFSLLPLRVKDTDLRWGENITFSVGRYHIDVETGKTGEHFCGPLCHFLTPFLDALLLCGCDEIYLPKARDEAIQTRRHIFAKADSSPLSRNRANNIWNRHLGCHMHIARARIHTELGRLGSEGVAIALALCAQRDPATAKYYQGRAMRDALVIQSYDALTSDLTQAEVDDYFPDLDG